MSYYETPTKGNTVNREKFDRLKSKVKERSSEITLAAIAVAASSYAIYLKTKTVEEDLSDIRLAVPEETLRMMTEEDQWPFWIKDGRKIKLIPVYDED